ncbi:MAG TPA: hypothetical protein VGI19_02575 [Candidatus Cybelea sp.]|jgi:hypothetical protein
MKFSRLCTFALGLSTAAALIAGCSSNAGSAPITAAHPNLGALNQVASLTPDMHKKKRAPYQYMSVSNAILEYDYPRSDKAIGQISLNSGAGECADTLHGAAKRDFWVTLPVPAEFDEFALGSAKPIKTLTESAGEPANCAMDPRTGNLAAPILSNGDVVIFQHASGSGTTMTTRLFEAYFDGYDNNGNLFVDGRNDSLTFGLVELPNGSSTFENISISNTIEFPGAVQWDGKYLTVGDQEAHTIYRYTVSGTTATLKGTVSLTGASDCGQTWIGSGGRVFCPDSSNSQGEVYKYPAGGSPVAILTTNGYGPGGVVEVRK